MGVAISTTFADASTRRRSSPGSRGFRTSILHNPFANSMDDILVSPQRQLSKRTPPKPTPTPTTPSGNAARKDSVNEASPSIIPKDRTNSCTVNSVHVTSWNPETVTSPFGAPTPAGKTLTSSPPPPPEPRPPLTNETAIDVDNTHMDVANGFDSPDIDASKSVANSSPPAVLRGENAKPSNHNSNSNGNNNSRSSRTAAAVARTLKWADTCSPLLPLPPSAPRHSKATPTLTSPTDFCPWEMQRTGSTSFNDTGDFSKAAKATTAFKASCQRFSEEARTRGNSNSVNRHTRSDSLNGARSSRGDRRTDSTQLSTEEWSRLLEVADTGNALICIDDKMQLSQDKPKVHSLPKYPATDVAAAAATAASSTEEHPFTRNTSLCAEKVDFTPLRMRFSETTSLLSDPCGTETELQRAMSAVDTYATNMRKLITSWQDIIGKNFDAFVREMGAALALKPPASGNLLNSSSAEEQARMMLRMIGQAVPLVTQMDDMFGTLLEMGAMHRRYDIHASHFEALHQAFMEVLPHFVAAADRQALCDVVWEPFWQVVVKLLSQGTNSSRGEWYAAQRQAEWMAEVRAILEVVAEQQQATAYRGSFVPAMLDRAEAADPAMAQFFLMREPRTAIRSFEGLVFVALEIDDEAERMRHVEQLAHEHIAYGLTEWGLHELRQPFIETTEHYARLSAHPDVWKAATAAESLGLFWDMITRYWIGGITLSRRSLVDIRGMSAPSGSRPFCMLFTEVEAASRLWEISPCVMADAMDAHNKLLRKLIAENSAYEVKTDGDSMVIATKDVFAAVQIAVSFQLELMRRPIVEDFRMVPVVQGGGLASCWRNDSLRVRIGIHYCTDASAVYDSVQRRFDYYGPSVNCASRTAAAAAGGQILLTQSAVNALRVHAAETEDGAAVQTPIAEIPPGTNPMDAVLDNLLEFQWWGEQRFRGISDPVSLYSVLPMRLSSRTFPYYVGNRKVRVSAPSDIDGRKELYRLTLAQLKSGHMNEMAMGLFQL